MFCFQFLQSVRKAGVLEENVGPAIVHCSAGIGRSGTFCLVDCCLIIVSRTFLVLNCFYRKYRKFKIINNKK